MLEAIRTRPGLRTGLLSIVMVVVLYVLLPYRYQILVFYYLGAPLIIGALIGATFGWITFSLKVFSWVTAVVATCCLAILVVRPDLWT